MRIQLKRVVLLVLQSIMIAILYWLYFYSPSFPLGPMEDRTFFSDNDIIRSTKSSRQILHSDQKDWQPVSGSRYLFSIYSAYSVLPNLLSPDVLIIGVTRTNTKENILCQFHMKEMGTSKSTPAPYFSQGRIEILKENWKRNYSGVFIRCPLPRTSTDNNIRPEMVSVIMARGNDTKVEEVPSNKVKIQYQYEYRNEDESPKYDYTFSVCVLPTYKYNETFRLLEWMEFYKMMGVEQFTFYNVSFGPDASCILNDLMGGSDPSIKVNVHPWHENPVKKQGQIRGNCAECSLSAGTNDCVYRHRGRNSKYMAFVDLDEYLMPRQNICKNYSQLIARLDAENPTKNIVHYQFKNGFFVLSRPDDPSLQDRCYVYKSNPLQYDVCQGSLMMKKVAREKLYQKFNQRSKYIIKPEGIKQAGNHYIYQFQLGYQYTSVRVSEKLAFLRHYRDWGVDQKKVISENDGIPLEFGLDLVERISKKVDYFRNKCKLNVVHHGG